MDIAFILDKDKQFDYLFGEINQENIILKYRRTKDTPLISWVYSKETKEYKKNDITVSGEDAKQFMQLFKYAQNSPNIKGFEIKKKGNKTTSVPIPISDSTTTGNISTANYLAMFFNQV